MCFFQLAESPLELPEPKLNSSHQGNSETSPCSDIVEPLRQEILSLKQQLHEAHTRLAHITLSRIEESGCDEETVTCDHHLSRTELKSSTLNSGKVSLEHYKTLESPESQIEADCEARSCGVEDKADVKFSSIVPIHKTPVKSDICNLPITKMAER